MEIINIFRKYIIFIDKNKYRSFFCYAGQVKIRNTGPTG